MLSFKWVFAGILGGSSITLLSEIGNASRYPSKGGTGTDEL